MNDERYNYQSSMRITETQSNEEKEKESDNLRKRTNSMFVCQSLTLLLFKSQNVTWLHVTCESGH